MQIKKQFLSLLTVALLLCSISVAAYAHEVPDISRRGSISITMTYDKNPVSGGMLTIYRVGAISEEDGNVYFVLTDEFSGSGADLTDFSNSEAANRLAEYITEQKLTGTTEEIGNDGKAVFEDIVPGLYLLVQTKATEGYKPAAPFLVSLPMNENGMYVYDVDASPKVELTKPEPTPPEKPTPGTEPPSGGNTPPKLPQTGQLNWPIPVLTVLGLVLFLVGWMLRFGQNGSSHEK